MSKSNSQNEALGVPNTSSGRPSEKTEQEFEEELQLALALSESEAEAAKKQQNKYKQQQNSATKANSTNSSSNSTSSGLKDVNKQTFNEAPPSAPYAEIMNNSKQQQHQQQQHMLVNEKPLEFGMGMPYQDEEVLKIKQYTCF